MQSQDSPDQATLEPSPEKLEPDWEEAELVVPEITEEVAARAAFQGCRLIVGLHPDQATEAIVDLALAVGSPFAIVPCCVYSAEFPKRRNLVTGKTARLLCSEL